MVSAHFKRYMTRNKLLVDSFTWIMPSKISLKFSKFKIQISTERVSMYQIRPRKINNLKVSMFVMKSRPGEQLARIHLKQDSDESEKSHLDLLEHLTIHLLNILSVKHFNFKCTTRIGSALHDLFVWKYAKQFKTVDVYAWARNPEVLSQADMIHFLEDVKTDDLQMSVKSEGFQYGGSVKCSNLNLGELSWVTNEFLRKMECREVTLRGDSGAHLDYNEFLKNWIQGEGNENLEELSISFGVETQCDARKFLKGIEVVDSILSAPDLKRRQARPERVVGDIRRKTDGRLATITVYPPPHASIQMIIWHPQHMELWDNETKKRFEVSKNF